MISLTFLQTFSTVLIALFVFIFIILFYIAGHKLRQVFVNRNPELKETELGAINGTLLGLLGLLLAFTFSMSSSRYDRKRDLVIEEANNIGTAILRSDLYPDSIRQLFRNNFKEYVAARINYYNVGKDLEKINFYYLKADSIGKVLWDIAIADARMNNVILRSGQMIPALNAVIDITTTRRSALESTVPDPIIYLLFILCFSSSFLLGYDNKNKKFDWILVFGLGLMLSVTVYNIIDIDRARSGLTNLDKPNEKIIELLDMLK